MKGIKLLKDQHRDVESLFERFESLEEDATAEKQECFEELADKLAAHTQIEEEYFYPAVRLEETEELLEESVHEHLEAKRLLASLLELNDVTSEDFAAKMSELKEAVLEHVDLEENEVMPKVQRLFTREELDDLGDQMEELFYELIEMEPRQEIPAHTDTPAPLT